MSLRGNDVQSSYPNTQVTHISKNEQAVRGGRVKRMAQILPHEKGRILRPRSAMSYAEPTPWELEEWDSRISPSGSDQDLLDLEASSISFGQGLKSATQILEERAQHPAIRPQETSDWRRYLHPMNSISGRTGRAAGRAPGSLDDVNRWGEPYEYIKDLREWQGRKDLDTPLIRHSLPAYLYPNSRH
jgi:hypothetical protein